MKVIYQLLLLFMITISCNKNTKKENKQLETVKNDSIAAVANNSQEHSTKIHFQNFTINIDGLEAFDENGVLKQVQKDTATVYLELGESIEGKKIKIQSKFSEFEMYQRLENSITVADEGPHCDLTEWKHYNSDWVRIKNTGEEFVANTYTKEDKEKFISLTEEEVLEGVGRYCEDKWVQFIKENSTKYPSYYVSPSKMFLKIVVQGETGKTEEKIIVFVLPMGC